MPGIPQPPSPPAEPESRQAGEGAGSRAWRRTGLGQSEMGGKPRLREETSKWLLNDQRVTRGGDPREVAEAELDSTPFF